MGENLNLIKVQYANSKDLSGFSKREYTYNTPLSLLDGDLVNAPTRNGLLKARVSVSDSKLIEMPPFDLNTIEELFEEPEEEEVNE